MLDTSGRAGEVLKAIKLRALLLECRSLREDLMDLLKLDV
jgi:hypothetical protein